MDDALFSLWREAKCTKDDVMAKAQSPDELAHASPTPSAACSTTKTKKAANEGQKKGRNGQTTRGPRITNETAPHFPNRTTTFDNSLNPTTPLNHPASLS